MYDNTDSKLTRTVTISAEAFDAVKKMAGVWEVDNDHAADRMLVVSLGRLMALSKYNKAQKKEAREKAAKTKARKAAKKPAASKADAPKS